MLTLRTSDRPAAAPNQQSDGTWSYADTGGAMPHESRRQATTASPCSLYVVQGYPEGLGTHCPKRALTRTSSLVCAWTRSESRRSCRDALSYPKSEAAAPVAITRGFEALEPLQTLHALKVICAPSRCQAFTSAATTCAWKTRSFSSPSASCA